MMFVSVGGQKPFPRLCVAAERLARDLSMECIIQSAEPGKRYEAATVFDFISGVRFDELLSSCSLFISHAGMGNILVARRLGKPIVVLPRRASLKEHRNDHQLGTAEALQSLTSVHVAWNEAQLADAALLVLRAGDSQAPTDTRNVSTPRFTLANELVQVINDVAARHE